MEGNFTAEDYYDDSIKKNQYTPKAKGNVGSIINNVSSKYIESNLLVSHEITVPIYKNEASYKKEEKTKKYNGKSNRKLK